MSLKKCSIEHIRDCFLLIEEPEDTALQPEAPTGDTTPSVHHPLTIGWYYKEIESAFEALSKDKDIFVGDPARQITGWPSMGELVEVKDIPSAKKAIDEIIEQGEGTSITNPTDLEGEIAHYFRFQEIVHGRRIVMADDGFSYTGAPVPFDPDGVWPMMDNPSTAELPEGSRARLLSEHFNRNYAQVLRALNRVVGGHPDELPRALGLMYNLQMSARMLMQAPSGRNDGTTAGPAFQVDTT